MQPNQTKKRADAYWESVGDRYRLGKPGNHGAQLFHEGWALECECGFESHADTRAEVEANYRSHLKGRHG